MPATIPIPSLFRHYRKRTRLGPKGCWLWLGCKTKRGYGRVTFQQRNFILHRLVWSILKGPVPRGIDVCHRCDIPACWNVDHLFLGTRQDNLSDAVAKGRMARGSAHYNARLRESDIEDIRRRLLVGHTHREIADSYCVVRETISQIAQRKNWAWV